RHGLERRRMFTKRNYVCAFAIAILLSTFSLTGQIAQNPARGGQAATAQGTRGQRAGGGGRGDPWPGMKKLLLVADVQTGYHHDSLNHAMATVEKLGRESGVYVTVLRTDTQLITKQPIVGQGK